MLEGKVKYSKRGGGVLLFCYSENGTTTSKGSIMVEVPITFMDECKHLDLLNSHIRLKKYEFVRLCKIKEEVNFEMWNNVINCEKILETPSMFEAEEEEQQQVGKDYKKKFIEVHEFEFIKRGNFIKDLKNNNNNNVNCIGKGMLTACSAIFPNKQDELEFYCEIDFKIVLICQGENVCKLRPLLSMFQYYEFFASSSSSCVVDCFINSYTPTAKELVDSPPSLLTPFVSYTGKKT